MDNKVKSLSVVELVLAIIGLLVIFELYTLNKLSNQLKQQYQFYAEQVLCNQDARVYQTYCQLERDEDGSYSWYFNSGENQ